MVYGSLIPLTIGGAGSQEVNAVMLLDKFIRIL